MKSLLLLLFLLSAFTSAYASTLFSDFGPGETAPGGFPAAVINYTITGSSTPEKYNELGYSFTPATNFSLTQIDIALVRTSGTNSVTVEIDTATGGFPGTALASWVVTSLPQNSSNPYTPETLTSAGVALVGGTTYWITVRPTTNNSNTVAGWAQNDQNVMNAGASTTKSNGTGWVNNTVESEGAFDLIGSAIVPEPGSGAALAFGLGAFGLLRARRR